MFTKVHTVESIRGTEPLILTSEGLETFCVGLRFVYVFHYFVEGTVKDIPVIVIL